MAKDTRQSEKEEAEQRSVERADQSKTYELDLTHVNKPDLPLLEKTLATAKPAPRNYDSVNAVLDENELDKSGPAKREALNILSDLIEFSKSSHREQPKRARS
jgi:hypothetical protein